MSSIACCLAGYCRSAISLGGVLLCDQPVVMIQRPTWFGIPDAATAGMVIAAMLVFVVADFSLPLPMQFELNVGRDRRIAIGEIR